MDEVDIGVGLEQVAPGPFAGMRLSGDQQHAQLVAHALDRDDGAIIGKRELVIERRRLDLDDIGPAAVDPNRHLHDLTRGDLTASDDLAVAADRQPGAAGAALVDDAQANDLILADDAEARRIDKYDPAVDLG